MPHDKNDIKTAIYSVLGTLAEEDDHSTGIPESYAYLAIGGNIEMWNTVRAVISPDWGRISGNLITLTDEGRELGTAINQALAKNG